jgi:hypothetical protein
VDHAGPGKLLFGSDGPWLHPGVELEKVRALRLPADAEQQVLGGNLLRLIGRVKRAPRSGLDGAGTRARPRADDPWAAEQFVE